MWFLHKYQFFFIRIVIDSRVIESTTLMITIVTTIDEFDVNTILVYFSAP